MKKTNFDEKAMRLYAVTDRTWVGDKTLLWQVEQALEGGVTCVQIREKDLNPEAFLEEAMAMKVLCDKYNVPLIINDNVEIAIKVGAAGVHVGQGDTPIAEVRKMAGEDIIVGVSARTVEQALAAQEGGADYLGVGAVFGTTTKLDAKPIERATLEAICRAVDIPIVAIGGVSKDNIPQLKGSGVDGVAVVSAIFAAEDIKSRCETLRKLSEDMVGAQDTSMNNAMPIERKTDTSMKTALTIAGSDSCGGAGIQADIKTMTMNGVYAMSAITALTAQNTTGVTGISEMTPDFLKLQLDAVFEDIFPAAVKIGMVSSAALIEIIAERLDYWKASNIVVDPVMVATSGARLISEDAVEILKAKLLPLATVVTPNIPEAELLSGMSISNADEMVNAAKYISEKYNCAVLCKGGHSINDANDLLYYEGKYEWFEGKRINNPNTHGTGCTLSSAIASNLAKGENLSDSIRNAKAYISGALAAMLDLGKGSGPMNHAFALKM